MQEISYKCKECGSICNSTYFQAVKLEKLCSNCYYNKRKEKRRQKAKQRIRKYKKEISKTFCQCCGKEFDSFTAKYCSKECRSKAIVKTRFYNQLAIANKEILVCETNVYGQGKYEKINYIGDIN